MLPDRVFGADEKPSFFGEVDYLLITPPLTPTSEGLIDDAELSMLRPSVMLINSARAAIVQGQVLLRSLREVWIRGASFDVHYEYPLPPQYLLWSMSNVILTPHISGSNHGPHFLTRLYDMFKEKLCRFCEGRLLLNQLSGSQLRGL